MAEHSFRFTDVQWTAINAEIAALGRQSEHDRQQLELHCDRFARSRPKRGPGLPTPAKARKQWLEVAKASRRLDDAIKGLRDAGAADFTMLDGHQGGASKWAAALPGIAAEAEQAAKLESYVETPANNADPMLDGFVTLLVRTWEAFGGDAAIGYNDGTGTPCGPLLRFLTAVTEPTLQAAGEDPLTASALRSKVRKYGELNAENNLSTPLD
jgi:hypothetical protein